MKNKHIILSWIAFVGIIDCIFVFVWILYINKWHENQSNLDATVHVGILVQEVADEFYQQTGHYPTSAELSQLSYYIGPYEEGVSPNITNTIASVSDNSGGWFYSEKTGDVRINSSGKYVIGFQSWVDPSEINFHPPTKVDEIHFGRSKILDYSWLNDRLSAMKPQIAEVITNWVTTNMMTTEPKSITKP